MITDYSQFNYESDFTPEYNIFNVNSIRGNIGIGTYNPQHILDIHGNLNVSGNLNIFGNMLFKNSTYSNPNILQFIPSNNQIKSSSLLSYQNDTTANKFTWKNPNNLLTLDFENERDNTPYYFQSNSYILNNPIKLFSKYDISITHLYLYKIHNVNQIILNTFNITNLKITVNSIEYTLTKINDFYYKLSTPIILPKNQYTTFTFTNYDNLHSIVFLGKYNFTSSFLWNSNSHDNIYIYKNISILTDNNHNNQLYVNRSAIFSNNCSIKNTLNINIDSNINKTLINKDYTIASNITSNNLFINNTNISIGTTNTNNFFSVGDNFIIHLNGNVHTPNLSTSNNLLLSNYNSFINNNNHIMFFNKTSTNHLLNINTLHISRPSTNSSKLNDTNIYINNNLNIGSSSFTNNRLNINGDSNINGILTITDKINIQHFDHLYYYYINKINTNIYKNNHLLNVSGYTNINQLVSKNTSTNSILFPTLPTSSFNQNLNFYFNSTNNCFMGFTNNKHIKFYNYEDKKNALSVFSNYNIPGFSDFLYTNSSNTISNNITVTNYFKLPQKNNYNSIYNINVNNSYGSMRFNCSSFYPEIYNGYNWGSIKYNNSHSEIKNIFLGDSNKLTPIYNSRIFNYTYSDTNVINPNNISIITAPYTHININLSYPGSNKYLSNFNNSYQFNSFNCNYSNSTNILIKSNLNDSTDYLSYNIKINLT